MYYSCKKKKDKMKKNEILSLLVSLLDLKKSHFLTQI